ncbi:hypothetical protein BKA70DRAFT_1246139 [Coprinopsis sp. MPI-PUGE-AT-0042]|nr:hypothetical protein BKA70DRAFT_1246139 [Coprinopsis sp. MPI-PUGE-AT-0042]
MPRRRSIAGSEVSRSTPPEKRRRSSTVGAQLNLPPPAPCSALMEDETPCNQPGTNGDPNKPERRCRMHNEEYQNSYLSYKAASDIVQSMKADGRIPSVLDIKETLIPSWLEDKADWLERYRVALEDELTGRESHTRRFFSNSERKLHPHIICSDEYY